eukprot:scaffold217143_cov23-Prasinocladus_malaysianus.AAC.1
MLKHTVIAFQRYWEPNQVTNNRVRTICPPAANTSHCKISWRAQYWQRRPCGQLSKKRQAVRLVKIK